MDENSDDSPKQVPIRDLKIDPTAEDLLNSPAVQPHMNLAIAVMGHEDVGPAVEAITALPLEKRYTWRVASALKSVFADFENLSVVADPEDPLPRGSRQAGGSSESSSTSVLHVLGSALWRRAYGKADLLVRRASQNLAGKSAEEPGTGAGGCGRVGR